MAIQSFIWHLADGTVETQFIFTLFHLLLAGLAAMVLLHHRRATPAEGMQAPYRRLLLGSFLFVFDFAVHLIYFGAEFYFRTAFQWTRLESLSHGLRACGVLAVVSAYLLELETKNKVESCRAFVWSPEFGRCSVPAASGNAVCALAIWRATAS